LLNVFCSNMHINTNKKKREMIIEHSLLDKIPTPYHYTYFPFFFLFSFLLPLHSLQFSLCFSSLPLLCQFSDENQIGIPTTGKWMGLGWREGENRLSPAAGGVRPRFELVDGYEDDGGWRLRWLWGRRLGRRWNNRLRHGTQRAETKKRGLMVVVVNDHGGCEDNGGERRWLERQWGDDGSEEDGRRMERTYAEKKGERKKMGVVYL